MNITVFGGARSGAAPEYVEAAAELGAFLAAAAHAVVYGGGHVGMMGALADAALAQGGEVIGVIPTFMVEREWAHTGITHMHVTETMAERKTKMRELGDAFIAMPGGTGTLEEIAEMISLRNLGISDGPCIFLNIRGYYEPLRSMFDAMVESGYLGQTERESIAFAGRVAEIADYLPQP